MRMKKFLLLFVFLLSLFAVQDTSASHVMGSDIVYKCLGNGKYEILVRVYRDCNGIQVSQSNVIARCGSNTVTISNQTKVSQRDITGIDARCPIQSRCSGSYPYGVQEHIWKMTLDLSSYSCCEWELSWSQCCRNGNISTGQAGQNFYTTANLNKCVTPCNSSPDFTNPPVAIICQNQDFVFNNGALDTIDSGDSLSYELVAGLQGAGSQVSYTGQFSPTRPLTFFGFPNQNLSWPAGFRLDPLTGDLLFRPTQVNQVAIVVIEVKEWRKVNGQMEVIGKTRRDMQIIVVACPQNNVPEIDPPYSVQACAGQQQCITITTDDENQDDTVKISWNRGIPGATFTNNNGSVKHAEGEVCWTPDSSDVSNIPYTFTITARDDACPLAGQAVRAFSIFVRETPRADRTINVLNCGKVAIKFEPRKQYSGLSKEWVIRDSNNVGVWSSSNQVDTAFLQPGIYRSFLTLTTSTPCINIHIDSIVVPDFVQVKVPSDTFICDGNAVTIESTTIFGDAPYEYVWTPFPDTGDVDTLTIQEDITVNPDTNNRYVIQVKDDNGCYNWDTVNVAWAPLPPVNTGPDQRVCLNEYVTFDGGNDSMTLDYLWSTGDTSRTISVTDSNEYRVIVTDSIGCANADTVNLFVNNPKPKLGPDLTLCENDTVTITAEDADTYQWFDLAGFTVSPLPTPIATGPSYFATVTGNVGYVVKGTQTYQNVTCFAFDTIRVNMNPLPEITLTPQGPHCIDAGKVSLMTYVTYPTLTNGNWRSDVNASYVDNNLFDPNLAGPNQTPGHTVVYRVTDNNGCTNEESTHVEVSPLPNVLLDDSIALCGDQGDLLLNSIKTYPVQTFSGKPEWFSRDNLPIVNSNIDKFDQHNQKLKINNLPQGQSYWLVFRYTNLATQCSNRDTIKVRVKEVPQTEAGFISPLCWNDERINLNQEANPSPIGAGGTGVWFTETPNLVYLDSFFTPSDVGAGFKFSPPNTQVKLKYRYTSSEGCAKVDSLSLNVKAIPDVKLTPLLGICEDSLAVDLTNRATPTGAGGTWFGDGINGNMFTAADAGVGLKWLKYEYTSPISQCTNSDSFQLEVQAKPEIEFETPTAACAGNPFPLSVNIINAPGILWSRIGDGEYDAQGSGQGTSSLATTTYYPGQGDINNNRFRILAETTNPRFCQPARIDEEIGIFPIPTIAIDADPLIICNPDDVNLQAITDAGPGVTLDWSFGDGTSMNGRDEMRDTLHRYTQHGQFTINLKINSDSSVGYCENNATPVDITVYPSPDAQFTASRFKTTVALPGIQFTDKSTIDAPGQIIKWNWTFGDRNQSGSTQQNPFFEYPITEPTDTGVFFVNLYVEAQDHGCWDTITHPITIDPDITVFIPNAFTPNNFGESFNERFYVVADGFETFEITIFNRWGEEMYYSTDIEEGWDGKYKGNEAQQDVYVYVVRVTSLAGKEFEYYGTITLLR